MFSRVRSRVLTEQNSSLAAALNMGFEKISRLRTLSVFRHIRPFSRLKKLASEYANALSDRNHLDQ
jgi:hypothetical protein